MNIQQFVFNEFLENTYVLWDESNECIIIDAGCHLPDERNDLKKFIDEKKLKPVALVNTHAHIDHIFGLNWAKKTFSIPFYLHSSELPVLNYALQTAQIYGLVLDLPPSPDNMLEEGDFFSLGNTRLKILFTPGHSPGSVSLYNAEDNLLISGDVLFQNSIGRFDLPGGNYEILMKSIFTQLLVLPDETLVYSGHGAVTSIGEEKRNNPFLLEYQSSN